MSEKTFRAMRVIESEDGQFRREIVKRRVEDLPPGDVLIKVLYSSLNYKDALSATGNKGVTRTYPHTPGIDAAGLVEESTDANFAVGDEVLVTGYDLGMNTPGGFGGYIRVPASWVIPIPKGISLVKSMMYGTAGFTAALSVYKLIRSGVKPEDGSILVTGATGGVGSIAVSILAKLGYFVVAGTGKPEFADLLKGMGAKDVVTRQDIDDSSGKPLLKPRWAGVVDTVGGNILSTALRSTQYGGTITTCGNVASHEFSANVYPFILKGISLLGIDSVECPMSLRRTIWSLLAGEWDLPNLEQTVTKVALEDLEPQIHQVLNGKSVGRVLVTI